MNYQPNDQITTQRAHRLAHVETTRAALAAAIDVVALTAHERADLLLMREEEKIARDVYLQLHDRWGLRPFGNISGSEQAHMDMILLLQERHGLSDPAEGLPIGRFNDPVLQNMHDDLLSRGLQSQAEAVRVGLLIEELDIFDLQVAASRTEKPEIRAVYSDLERGSRNHLRAFYRWMHRLGTHYTPVHLTAGMFAAIANAPHESCH
ncbi:DUF2202 domain-containing protein [Acidiphilium acidophilum]|uniref:DUF2202 domain-containing protein n=1 Tax=Acidiphilium acidophilum TaxID=76588 RepID=UPI002E8E61A5|nr:DUF2202 domain-containing protein [Acidiphilium acidophilum]